MSKHINVNPDHYKVGGRERPGNQTAKAPKQEYAVNRKMEAGKAKRKKG